MKIGYFLEDIAQENFLKALVEKVTTGQAQASFSIDHDVRNATGGAGRCEKELQQFLTNVAAQSYSPWDLLIVAIDGNCTTWHKKKKRIDGIVTGASYTGHFVCAIPDPHIERWYLDDPQAFQRATGCGSVPGLPRRKCERKFYKDFIKQELRKISLRPPLGGAEYGASIVAEMNLYEAGRADPSLKSFIDELSHGLQE